MPTQVMAVKAYAVADDNFDYPDHLVEIDLESGDFKSFGRIPDPYIGIEGMALSANNVIYGADDNTKTLVQIEVSDARALPVANVNQNFGFPRSTENHDYGMTFACDGRLFLAVKHNQSLYQVNPETGRADLIGSTGHNFTSLASWDNRLYGVASGDFNLYEINPDTAHATVVGSLGNLGGGIELYGSGMSFDAEGQLWMIINLRLSDPLNPFPSRIFKIDTETGQADYISDTLVGVESLAIANGQGCARGTPMAEQVPTLNQFNVLILILIMSSVGLLAVRRNY
ncbi:NHL repeat-containing protein [Marinicella gelatinilytica]|uniref:hypothetical protein n=1 Tax=Marinicella gelatinilytica TaxID=2996017 RepID=UPI002260C556|nr:hypothetical protein [Marinicella gelatinilytica]MCX7544048.1 hypothetical protein [Marinicella gelatinilytica]